MKFRRKHLYLAWSFATPQLVWVSPTDLLLEMENWPFPATL